MAPEWKTDEALAPLLLEAGDLPTIKASAAGQRVSERILCRVCSMRAREGGGHRVRQRRRDAVAEL